MADVKTLRDLVTRADELFGSEPYIREYRNKEFADTSFHDLRSDCESVGAWLQKRFSGRKVHAAVFGATSSEYLKAFFGTVLSGNVAVPLDTANSPEKIADEIDRSDSEIVFFDEKHMKDLDTFRELCKKVKYFVHLNTKHDDMPVLSEMIEECRGEKPAADIDEDDLAAILFTSGTTGRSKGVMLSHGNLIDNTTCYDDGEFHGSRLLSVLPIHHVYIQVFGEDFKRIYSGGAYLSPEIINGYKEFGIEICQGYGMTECSPRICTGIPNSPKPDSVGKIVNGCEVKIVDGEIWAKSKSVMKGYYNDPAETANSLSPDGWLMTGDLGHTDEDGYLYITGRKKNLIILSNGENVSPEEIENKFATFAPIKEMVVYAVGERITAQIFPNADYPSDDIEAEIRAGVEKVNASFPQAYRIVDIIFRDHEFVKTASRKIIRGRINE